MAKWKGGVGTYAIGNGTAHRGDHSDTTSVSKANHLLSHSLGGHEHSRDVDFEHGVAVLGRVLERWGLLLNTRCGNKTIHAALFIGDGLDHTVQKFCVTHVNTTVVQFGAKLNCALLDLFKLGSLVIDWLLV
jgi:hypothetical protein